MHTHTNTPDRLPRPSPLPHSPSGLVSRLKMLGMRVCAFGWQPQGPQRELIESSGVDGFLMGPIHPQVHGSQTFVCPYYQTACI